MERPLTSHLSMPSRYQLLISYMILLRSLTSGTSASFRIVHMNYPSRYMTAFASCHLLLPLSHPFPSRGRYPCQGGHRGFHVRYGRRFRSVQVPSIGRRVIVRSMMGTQHFHHPTQVPFWSVRSPFRVRFVFARCQVTALTTIHSTFTMPNTP